MEAHMFKVINNRFILAEENRVWVFKASLANELNKVLNTYKDYRFSSKKAEEPVFTFTDSQKNVVYHILKVKI